MAERDLLEMETAPETINYRKARLKNWESIVAAYSDYYEDAVRYGASELQAREAAGKYVRGDIRWIVSEGLTHAPAAEAAAFMENAPRSWGLTTESLLFADPGVPALLASSFPFITWAEKLDVLTKATAADEQTWGQWATDAAVSLGIPQATKAMFSAAGDIASGVGSAAKGAGEGIGGAAKGVGEGLGGIGHGLGTALRYVPVAVAALGAVAVYAFYKYLVPADRALPRTRIISDEGVQSLGKRRVR